MSAEAGSAETGRVARWLQRRRVAIVLVIGACEAVVVAFDERFSRWTVLGLAVIFAGVYFLWGRTFTSATARELIWILAASQALTLIAVLAASLIGLLALVIAGIFAFAVLVVLFADRARTRRRG